MCRMHMPKFHRRQISIWNGKHALRAAGGRYTCRYQQTGDLPWQAVAVVLVCTQMPSTFQKPFAPMLKSEPVVKPEPLPRSTAVKKEEPAPWEFTLSPDPVPAPEFVAAGPAAPAAPVAPAAPGLAARRKLPVTVAIRILTKGRVPESEIQATARDAVLHLFRHFKANPTCNAPCHCTLHRNLSVLIDVEHLRKCTDKTCPELDCKVVQQFRTHVAQCDGKCAKCVKAGLASSLCPCGLCLKTTAPGPAPAPVDGFGPMLERLPLPPAAPPATMRICLPGTACLRDMLYPELTARVMSGVTDVMRRIAPGMSLVIIKHPTTSEVTIGVDGRRDVVKFCLQRREVTVSLPNGDSWAMLPSHVTMLPSDRPRDDVVVELPTREAHVITGVITLLGRNKPSWTPPAVTSGMYPLLYRQHWLAVDLYIEALFAELYTIKAVHDVSTCVAADAVGPLAKHVSRSVEHALAKVKPPVSKKRAAETTTFYKVDIVVKVSRVDKAE
jgi:hypothetical protein